MNFYNIDNSFDILRYQIQMIQRIKSKLITCGILYDDNKLYNYYKFLPEFNYSQQGNINKNKDVLLIIIPINNIDKNNMNTDIEAAFIKYLIYNTQEAFENLSSDEYSFYSNPINAKLFYNIEYYSNKNIIILRI